MEQKLVKLQLVVGMVDKLKWLVLVKNLMGCVQCGRDVSKLFICKVAASVRTEVEEVLF